jgi:hypothetical protein
MLALKGLFSGPGTFNKITRIFELQPQISFVPAWHNIYILWIQKLVRLTTGSVGISHKVQNIQINTI